VARRPRVLRHQRRLDVLGVRAHVVIADTATRSSGRDGQKYLWLRVLAARRALDRLGDGVPVEQSPRSTGPLISRLR
jgi:hypothetical protein